MGVAHAAATLLLLCIAHAASVAAAHATASCGGSSVLAGHTSSGVAVCEDLRHNGSFVFQSSPSISLGKRVYAQRPPNTRWSEAGEHDALQRLLVEDPSGSLVSGAALIVNASDPIYDAVFAMAPPIQASQFSSLRFTGSREARMDIIFDHRGGGLVWNGQPLPENVIAEQINYNKTMEGLVGGELPIMHFVLAVDSDIKPSGWWEVTAVPQAENDGSHEQGCFYRFQRIIEEKTNETAAAGGKGATAALTLGQVTYFETYQYVAGAFTAEPEHFFDAMLAQRNFWDRTWAEEGIMQAQLPSVSGTDGAVLLDQAKHGFVRDMITRTEVWWPRYGVGNAEGTGYEQAGHSNGFQEIFSASMMAALTWGADAYAAGVLENQLRYYVLRNGTVAYRGIELPQSARGLTAMAAYYRQTGDKSGLLLKYAEKILGIVELLRRKWQQARSGDKGSAAYGIIRANDEADSFVNSVTMKCTGVAGQSCGTELPFFSTSTEFLRGGTDIGEVFRDLGAAAGRPDLTAAGTQLLKDMQEMQGDLELAFQRTHLPHGDGKYNFSCWPYVAGAKTCGEIKAVRAHNSGQYQRGLPESMFSGYVSKQTVVDELAVAKGTGALHLGTLVGQTFTSHGWGFGLLQHDLLPEFLLNLYSFSAHGYTRGTWCTPEECHFSSTDALSCESPACGSAECTNGKFNSQGCASPFAAPPVLTTALNLGWALVYEDPIERSLWLGKATPELWWTVGETIALRDAPTRYGRVTYAAEVTASSASINVTVPAAWATAAASAACAGSTDTSWCGAPRGGLMVRARLPGGAKITSATIGGAGAPTVWSGRADDATLTFTLHDLAQPGLLAQLQTIVVHY